MRDHTIVQTTYRDGGATNLLDYMEREGSPLRDRTGRELSREQREKFVAKSERHNVQRDLIISPANGKELTDRDLDRGTRRTMREFTRDRRTATYAYAVHRDTEHPHVHVAVTGEKRDLYMDREDIAETREVAHEQYQTRSWNRERDLKQRLDRERDRDREQGRETPGHSGVEPFRADPETPLQERQRERQEREKEKERKREQERNFDRDRDRGLGR